MLKLRLKKLFTTNFILICKKNYLKSRIGKKLAGVKISTFLSPESFGFFLFTWFVRERMWKVFLMTKKTNLEQFFNLAWILKRFAYINFEFLKRSFASGKMKYFSIQPLKTFSNNLKRNPLFNLRLKGCHHNVKNMIRYSFGFLICQLVRVISEGLH